MERLSSKPTASQPQACRGWGETIAAYRFLGNDEVAWEAILAPHWEQTEQRMAAHPIVLCLQDTTELDFNVLKNGCRVEQMQLSSIDRLKCALALYLVVSWRIDYLVRMGRSCPDLFFDADRIRGAYLLTKVKQPHQKPKLNEVLRLIAQLGGFLDRKGDGEPDVKAIWEWLRNIHAAARTLQQLRAVGNVGSCV